MVLFRTNLTEANLENANLSGAKLYRACLKRANLAGANLDGADLFIFCRFKRSKLQQYFIIRSKFKRRDANGRATKLKNFQN